MKIEYLPMIPVVLLAILAAWTIYKMILTQIRGHRVGFICKFCGLIINADGERISGADEVRYDEKICRKCQKVDGRIEVDF